jgi:superoxide dismutase
MKMIPNIVDKGRKKLNKTYSSVEKLKKELLTTSSSRLGNGQSFTILRNSSSLNE